MLGDDEKKILAGKHVRANMKTIVLNLTGYCRARLGTHYEISIWECGIACIDCNNPGEIELGIL